MTVIFDPAEAIAAARCLNARSIADGTTDSHARRCGWCDYPLDELRAMVDGFNEWAGWKGRGERGGTAGRHEVRQFAELPRDEQRRRIEAAQDLEPEPELPPQPRPVVKPGIGTKGGVPEEPPQRKEGPAWLA